MNVVLKRGYGNIIIKKQIQQFLTYPSWLERCSQFRGSSTADNNYVLCARDIKKKKKKTPTTLIGSFSRKFRSSSFLLELLIGWLDGIQNNKDAVWEKIYRCWGYFSDVIFQTQKNIKRHEFKKNNFSLLYIFAIHVVFGNATFPFHFAIRTGVSSSYLFNAAYPLTCSIQSYIISVSAPTSSQGPLTKHVKWQTIYKLWQANTQSLEIMRVTPGLCCTSSGGGRGIFGWWGYVTAEVEGTQGVERLFGSRTKLFLITACFHCLM